MVKEKSMIIPGSRDAPKFQSARPRELRRFIRQLEDLWKDAGIETDKEKKESIGKYADKETRKSGVPLRPITLGILGPSSRRSCWIIIQKHRLQNGVHQREFGRSLETLIISSLVILLVCIRIGERS